MKSTIICICGCVLLALTLVSGAYAEQEINFICKNDCISRGGTLGYCNSLCSTTDSSGIPTKDSKCLSSCMDKGGTYYNCAKECGSTGGGDTGTTEAPTQVPDSGPRPQH